MHDSILYSNYPMSFVDLFTEYDIDVRKDFTESEREALISEAINYINNNPIKNDLLVNLKKVTVVIRGVDEAGNFITALTM